MEAADAVQNNVTAGFALHAADANVTVVLTPGWVPLLSEAMLGEPMQAPDDGAADLMQEVAAQGFGVVQTALADDGIELSALRFTAAGPNEAVAALDGPYWRVPFAVQQDDPPLYGFALLPAEAAPEAPPEADPSPSAAEASAAPPPAASSSAEPSDPQTGADESSGSVDVAPASFADLGSENVGGGDGGGPDNFELLAEVKLEVTVELGRRRLPLADVLKLTTGSVVELEKLVGEPLSVYANGRLIAEGEAVVIDEQFGVRITSLASKSRRDKAFF